MVPIRIAVQAEDFDLSTEVARLKKGAGQIGAVVSFTGVCRDDGGRLAALELEHYPGMVEEQIAKIVGDARERWTLAGVTVIHRFGRIVPGENIVLVVTASQHRRDAFEAAAFLMDYMKTTAPFWKKEHRVNAEEGWVGARDADDEALRRWQK